MPETNITNCTRYTKSQKFSKNCPQGQECQKQILGI